MKSEALLSGLVTQVEHFANFEGGVVGKGNHIGSPGVPLALCISLSLLSPLSLSLFPLPTRQANKEFHYLVPPPKEHF